MTLLESVLQKHPLGHFGNHLNSLVGIIRQDCAGVQGNVYAKCLRNCWYTKATNYYQ